MSNEIPKRYNCAGCGVSIPEDSVCSCFKTKEVITLDELRGHLYDVGTRQNNHDKNGMIWIQCGRIIDDCKEALILGMQKPQHIYEITQGRNGYGYRTYHVRGLKGEWTLFNFGHTDKDATEVEVLIQFKKLGLSCEFIENESESTETPIGSIDSVNKDFKA